MPQDPPYIVFAKLPVAGFAESKKGGIWYKRAESEAHAKALLELAGSGAWAKAIGHLHSKNGPAQHVYTSRTSGLSASLGSRGNSRRRGRGRRGM